MRLLSIFITRSFIYYYSTDLTPSESYLELTDQTDLTDSLSELISRLETAKVTHINFILDEKYIIYTYSHFPLTSRRKIDKILEFELEDILLSGSENYYFDYYSKTNRDLAITEVGVYAIQKSVLQILRKFCKDNNLELRWLLSLNNLFDLRTRQELRPGNNIFVLWHKNIARILVYRGSFLSAISSVALQQTTTDQPSSGLSQQYLDLINQQITCFRLKDNFDYEILIDPAIKPRVQVSDKQQLSLVEGQATESDTLDQIELKDLINPSLLNHPHRVNLLKSNLLLIQELKKHRRAFSVSVGIIVACLLMYTSSIGYNIIQDTKKLEVVNRKYAESINKYLPKGTSKTNAVYILRDDVAKLQKIQAKGRKFAKREYRVLKTLLQLSLLKNSTPSLHINRFSINDQSIRFQGKVNLISEFEQLKNELEALYSGKKYTLKYNQKSLGEDIVEFSVSIYKRTP